MHKRLIPDYRWEANQFIMASSCSRVYQVAENSPEEIEALKRGIEKVSDETRLDHRFVLAVILQESGGCVRVPTSSYGKCPSPSPSPSSSLPLSPLPQPNHPPY